MIVITTTISQNLTSDSQPRSSRLFFWKKQNLKHGGNRGINLGERRVFGGTRNPQGSPGQTGTLAPRYKPPKTLPPLMFIPPFPPACRVWFVLFLCLRPR